MKNFFLGLSFILAFNANAQFFIGPELGANFLPIRTSQMGTDYHFGLHGGLNMEYHFTDYLSLKSGLYFTQKKQAYSSFDTSGVEIFGFDLDGLIPGLSLEEYSETSGLISQSYLQIPIMASFSFHQLSISAGPYFGFMVRAWTKEETNNEIPLLNIFDFDSLDPSGLLSLFLPPSSSTDFVESSSKENLKVFDYGFKFALSYAMDDFGLKFSYLLGIPDYRLDRGELDLQKHSYFQASIHYNFQIGKSSSDSRY